MPSAPSRGLGGGLRLAVPADLYRRQTVRPRGRRQGAALGPRPGRPRAGRRLRHAQGTDRRDACSSSSPTSPPTWSMAREARAAGVDDQLAHLPAAERERPRRSSTGSRSHRGRRGRGHQLDDPAARHAGSRDKARVRPGTTPSASPCMSAGRRSMAAPISAMPARRWCSTRSARLIRHEFGARQPGLCPQCHRR